MRSLALASLLTGALLAGSACNLLLPIDCTLIGCSDALSVEVTDPGSERYRVGRWGHPIFGSSDPPSGFRITPRR